MTNQRLQWVALTIIFAIITIAVIMMWWPYLTLLAMGFILAILFRPIYKNLLKKTGHEAMAAWGTIILILLIVIIPLYLIGQLLFNELVSLYAHYREGTLAWSPDTLSNLPPSLRTLVENFGSDLGQRFSGFATNAFAGITNVLSNVAGFFLGFFLVFFSIFYLLRDGDKLKKYLASIFPLAQTHEDILISKLERAVNGVVKGMFLIALIQGAVATLGFFIFKVPQPFLWGAFTFLAALVPTVGTSLSLIPAVLYLFFTGHTGLAIGMAIWGALAVGTIDNIIGPKIVGSRVDIHPMLILFSVLGGVSLFGVLGVLLGPILMTVFVTLLDIYRVDLKEHLGN